MMMIYINIPEQHLVTGRSVGGLSWAKGQRNRVENAPPVTGKTRHGLSSVIRLSSTITNASHVAVNDDDVHNAWGEGGI